jgi:uncharacterized protein GlcG (DUF336 family)
VAGERRTGPGDAGDRAGQANAAAGFHATTLDLEERFSSACSSPTTSPRWATTLVFGRGGVPWSRGSHIGAVGVSGAVPADNDHTIADGAGHPTIPASH